MLPHHIELMLQVPHLAQQVDPLAGLGVRQPPRVLQLSGQAGPVLARTGCRPLALLKLGKAVSIRIITAKIFG